MASKCPAHSNSKDGEGCDRCEVRGLLHATMAFIILSVFGYYMLRYPDPQTNRICSDSCNEAGHTEHAFDKQRGCVCSDPYPEVPEPTRVWVQP